MVRNKFNRTLLEKEETMHHAACLPKNLWNFALDTAVHVYNRTPMCRIGWKTPVELLFNKKPEISYLRVFGCLAYVHIPKDKRKDKLTPKAEEMIFLGYEPGTKGYCFLRNNRSIYVETTATFVENLFPNCPEEKLKKKIDIPEPIHPSEEEASGNNDDNNHQPPPDDLEFPPIDPPQPEDDHINGDDSKEDTTKPQSPPQRPPKPTQEEVTDDDTQAPHGGQRNPEYQQPGPSVPHGRVPHFDENTRTTPIPSRIPNVEPHRRNPPQVRNPPVRPGNVYGHRNPVDIEQEIAKEREWTRTVLERGVPNIPRFEPMDESGQDIPAPAEPQQEAPPIAAPLPSMDEDENEMEDVIVPNNDVDTMIQLGQHYILNYIMKQAAKPLKGIPYHYKDVKNYPLDEQKKWEQACKEEIKSIEDRNVWTLVDCPPDQKPIKCRWVFARNQMEDIKPAWLQKAFHKSMVKTTMKPSHRSHTLRQLDCSWLMHVEMTGKLKVLMSRLPSYMGDSMKKFTWSNPKVSKYPVQATKYIVYCALSTA